MKMPKITRLPSGAWHTQIMIERERVSITRPTKKDVQMEVMRLKSGTAKAERREAVTLREVAESFIERNRGTLAESTIAGYCKILRNQFSGLLDSRMRDITAERVQAAISEDARRYAPKTVRNGWGFISQVLTEYDGRSYEPALPGKVAYDRPYLDGEQIKALVAYLAQHEERAAIPCLLALHSLRLSEIAGMTWDCVDLKNGVLRVRGAVTYDEHNRAVRREQNKNFTSSRNVPIMIPLLAEMLEREQEKGGPLFSIAPKQISYNVADCLNRAGFPGVTAHGLRVSFASLAHDIGMPEEDTMAIGGWKDAAVMRSIYTKASQRTRAGWAAKMAQWYENG